MIDKGLEGDMRRNLKSHGPSARLGLGKNCTTRSNKYQPSNFSPSTNPATPAASQRRDHTVKMLIPKADRKKIHESVHLESHHHGAIETWNFARIVQLEQEPLLSP
jgi:hypothetical protein